MNSPALAVHVQDNPLAKLELARRLLAETRSVDEVKAIHNLAEAARVYARQARLGLETQNDAAEIKLRAERRLGELLAALPKQDGGDAARARSQAATEVPLRLDELGISKSQSSRCQTIATVPELVFEQYVTGVREGGRADGKTELTTTGALLVARQYRPLRIPTPLVVSRAQQLDPRHRFDVADAAALPWPDRSVDLVVTSPPYGLDVNYQGPDDSDYAGWLDRLHTWLAELYRIAQHASGRLCLNVPLDRDRGGWQPVSADAINVARAAGWQFRTWLLWDKLQAGAGTDRGSIDSAGAPNVTAPVESLLVFYRGSWYRSGPAAMPHQAWLDLCGPRGLWRFPGTSDPVSPAPFREELPERCITLFSFPEDVVADPFAGRGTTAAVAARLGRIAWTSDRDPTCIAAARAWVTREQSRQTERAPVMGAAHFVAP